MMDGIIPYTMIQDTNEMVSSLGSGFEVKGTVDDATDLPESGELGDLYLVKNEGYASYIWDGTEWALKDGGVASNAEILAALYS